jgi:hypothetical protein
MKFTSRRLAATIAALALAPLVHAHPGHDDPDLTWDFSHMAAHPGATVVCLAVLGVAAWGLWRATRAGGVFRRDAGQRSNGRRET